MATPFRLKRSSVPQKRPTLEDLQLGELALNTYDGRLFTKKDTGGVGVGTTVTLLNVWTENIGGEIYYTDGNVGVATDNPNYTLDVNGDLNFNGTLYKNGVEYVSGVGIRSDGNIISGSGTTVIDFVGTAVSTITSDAVSGIVTVRLEAGSFVKTVSNFTATTSQTTFNVTYTPGYIEVYVNGVRLTESEYTATNGTSVVLNEGANNGDNVDIIVFQNSGLFSSSKWFDGPNSSIYRIDGNVGIATAQPTSKLHVVGDSYITGVSTAIGGFNIGIQSGSTNITAGVITALNFIGVGNTFYYNSTTKTVDISIAGGTWTPIGTSIIYTERSVGIGTTTANARLDIEGVLGVDATVTGISTTTATTIDTLPIATYRSARFQVQITQSTDYQSTDLMVIHNGTTSNIIEYGSIATNDYLASFSSTISGSDLLLQTTMSSATAATVKVVRYGVTV